MTRDPLPPPPLTCLITPGLTTPATTPRAEEFGAVLRLVGRAAAAGVSLVQLREKRLTARALYELAARAAELTRGTETRLLVNDRADVARAAGCDGVHLTSSSIDAGTVRRLFGPDFVVGVSTHTHEEARGARASGADFAVLGPVFDTPSKRAYGPPLGLAYLARSARVLAPFPVLALGGVTADNAAEVMRAGAKGVAAIRLFCEAEDLGPVVRRIAGG